MSDTEIVNQIQDIRTINNRCWMNILRLALRVAPEATKSLLREINANDGKVSELLGKLASD